MAVFTTMSPTSSIARLFLLLTLAPLFFTAVMTSPVPADLAVKQVRSFDLSIESGDLEKRITHTGQGTFFYQNGHEGACGWKKSDNTYLVATSHVLWEQNGSGNCGQYVHISSQGKTAYALVADECPDSDCDLGHLDMSVGLFKHFASLNLGEIDIVWHFMPKGWKP